MSGEPAAIAAELASTGARSVYVDGGVTIQRLIGQGVPLFGTLPHDICLRHVATQAYKSGLVKSEYQVL
jgi:hypothetical protein